MIPLNTIASVSVDLDAVDCYWRIHALPGAPPEDARCAILRHCLPRFAELFARAGIKATFFVVGRDLIDDVQGRRLLSDLASDGHEMANHTHTHPYDLVRLPRPQIADEIDRAHDQIAGCAGHAPVGFRAPGYEVSGDVIDLLCARSYRYDSSAFPSVPYYAAKAAVMAGMRMVGRKSGSIVGSPRILTAPTGPYRPAAGQPYSRGLLPIVELPMSVTPCLRLPVIGTSLITAPPWLRRRLVASSLSQRFFNLELHGIDLADAITDGFPAALIARQPDLRRPLKAKREALESTLTEIRMAGGTFRTLAEIPATLRDV
ncbi:MAG: polysaccharide deacetylase family protein [Deltaproteobacteria bacterium]|nr:polysaccharide deacetylase family protein [Deltaproteobacteria bacterium]